MEFSWKPLTSENFDDIDQLFARPGGAVVRACYCVWFRDGTGTDKIPSRERRNVLRTLAESDLPPGILGYVDGVVVGWTSLGPRHDFSRLDRSPIMKKVDDEPVWSVPCFFVDRAWRGKGIATQLLAAAQEFAIQHNAQTLEAYPIDKPERTIDDSAFYGVKAMYDAAGFTEVARRKSHRPVVRKALSS